MVTGRDELAVVASGGCIYAMGGSHLVWPVPCRTGHQQTLMQMNLSIKHSHCDIPGFYIEI